MEPPRTCLLLLITYLGILANVDGFRNVALGKPASMNAYRNRNPPSAAVDGNATTFIHPPGSLVDPISWWEVDLLDTYYIVSVSITNRECCDNRLRNFTIDLISDDLSASPTTRLCHFYPGTVRKSVTEIIACDDVLTARKVRVSMEDRPLDFSEVSIKGLHACGGLQFTLNPGIRRLDTALRQLIVDSTATCAVRCRVEIDCDAFQTLTSALGVTCQLLVGQNGNTVTDNTWKYYSFIV
ncbi:fucolectin-4-like [Haliotis cracherodii]|uniref:fucolectin-4-like n=1 Tax=Haliotis cracherodii TaxID=6455 RepID=UPI0039E78CD9